eukprot:5611907-Ditylum_brightwellii.AAC.1
MAAIEAVDCSGVVGDAQVQQDGTFQTYLDFLDDWESSLLQNVDMLYPIHEIFDTLDEEAFIIATDGSSGGLAFGQASSFQSEAYGILSVLLFLHYANKYVQYKEQVGFKLYLDNESIIAWIKKQQQYPYNYSFNALTPDWDVIAQIVAARCRSDIRGEFEHVKGHQDKEKKYEDL